MAGVKVVMGWRWAKFWRTRDYRYVVNDAKLPDNFYEMEEL